jgi:hypothetical protein
VLIGKLMIFVCCRLFVVVLSVYAIVALQFEAWCDNHRIECALCILDLVSLTKKKANMTMIICLLFLH